MYTALVRPRRPGALATLVPHSAGLSHGWATPHGFPRGHRTEWEAVATKMSPFVQRTRFVALFLESKGSFPLRVDATDRT